MPNTTSAKKELRKNKRRATINKKQKVELKKTIKEFGRLVKEDKSKAQAHLSVVYKKLDKAVKTNLIKKNKASRTKSRLTKKVAA